MPMFNFSGKSDRVTMNPFCTNRSRLNGSTSGAPLTNFLLVRDLIPSQLILLDRYLLHTDMVLLLYHASTHPTKCCCLFMRFPLGIQGTSHSLLSKFITFSGQFALEHLLEKDVLRQSEKFTITLSYSFPNMLTSELMIGGEIMQNFHLNRHITKGKTSCEQLVSLSKSIQSLHCLSWENHRRNLTKLKLKSCKCSLMK